MIYDDNAVRAKYWEDIAKQAFDRIIDQIKTIEKLQAELEHERYMVRFLQDMSRGSK